jgi:hypothetical protein
MHKRITTLAFLLILLFTFQSNAQKSFNPDTVKFQKFDLGKMWTFEYAPVDYFNDTYKFRPTQEWLDATRLASPRFGRGCSAGFISEDGLILTNHHCVDGLITQIQREGENIPRDGFIAQTLAEERKVPNLFVSQLQLIKDVTAEIVESIAKGKNDKEKLEIKNAKITELQDKYSKETGLTCQVTSLFHGGKYSLYGYKRYTDVRAVIFVERIVGLYGGDPDNYTYPRYNSDFAVLRVYDETGKPLKSKNYFKMNTNGPNMGEVLFAIGYPGTTNRLKTVAQLEYNRDITYRNSIFQNNALIKIYNEMMKEFPAKADIYQGAQFGPANSGKRVSGFVTNLSDPYLMARKKAYENNLKSIVAKDPVKKKKYGHLWDAIAKAKKELSKHAGERAAFARLNNSLYFTAAYDLLEIAKQKMLPADKRDRQYQGEGLNRAINNIFPQDFDAPLEKKKLVMIIDFINLNLGQKHPLVKKYFNGKGPDIADKLIASTKLGDKDFVTNLAKGKPEDILSFIAKEKDTFLSYYNETRDKRIAYQVEADEIANTETVLEDQLGLAIFEIFGTSIPPDATGSLRITDAVIAEYEYNGTIAPPFTTFHGLYDRYYSHLKKWPWDLPARWLNYDSNFNLSAQNNFIGTFDTAGGSSGSPIINKKMEYVGIIHDGNIESLSSDFIYTVEKKRSLALSAQAIYEIVKDLFKVPRIAREFETGKIAE